MTGRQRLQRAGRIGAGVECGGARLLQRDVAAEHGCVAGSCNGQRDAVGIDYGDRNTCLTAQRIANLCACTIGDHQRLLHHGLHFACGECVAAIGAGDRWITIVAVTVVKHESIEARVQRRVGTHA